MQRTDQRRTAPFAAFSYRPRAAHHYHTLDRLITSLWSSTQRQCRSWPVLCEPSFSRAVGQCNFRRPPLPPPIRHPRVELDLPPDHDGMARLWLSFSTEDPGLVVGCTADSKESTMELVSRLLRVPDTPSVQRNIPTSGSFTSDDFVDAVDSGPRSSPASKSASSLSGMQRKKRAKRSGVERREAASYTTTATIVGTVLLARRRTTLRMSRRSRSVQVILLSQGYGLSNLLIRSGWRGNQSTA